MRRGHYLVSSQLFCVLRSRIAVAYLHTSEKIVSTISLLPFQFWIYFMQRIQNRYRKPKIIEAILTI